MQHGNDATIEVTADRLGRVEGTVWIFGGTLEDSDQRVWFAADHRQARQIATAIDFDGLAICKVPYWALIPTTTEV